MSGKLIVHGFNENLLLGGKPIKILIDGKEAGSVSKFETTVIDIEKECVLKLKYGLNTSKPTSIANNMVTEVQCRAGADRLHADILSCEPYNPAKQNSDSLAEMRKIVTQLKNGQLLTSDMAESFEAMRNRIFEATPDVEREAIVLQNEFDSIWEKQLAEEVEAEDTAVTNEHRMRCNVCGHVFCYTDEDVSKNAKNAGVGALAAIGGLASALGGGTIFHTHHLQGQADRYTDKIIDYSRCPSCHSTDISEMKDDSKATQQQNNTVAPAVSPIEEIKKYKELLDMGIITQEEFDVKKKQLLGL